MKRKAKPPVRVRKVRALPKRDLERAQRAQREARRAELAETEAAGGKLPALQTSYEGIEAYVIALGAAVAAKTIHRSDAKELGQLARTLLMSRRQQHQEREIEEMRVLLAEAKKVIREQQRLVTQDRFGAGTEGTFARFEDEVPPS